MKILVPTDFSDLSNVALNYAVSLAKQSGASIHLHYNAKYEGPPRAGLFIDLAEKVAQNASVDLNRFAKDLREKVGHSIDISWEVTSLPDHSRAIIHTAESSGSSVIIMGSKGKSGVQGAFVGQVAYQTLITTTTPVIVVPPQCEFKKEGNALMAVDVDNTPETSSLNALHRVLQLLKFDLDLLFADVKGDNDTIYQIRKDIETACSDVKVDAYFEEESNVVNAIENFLDSHQSRMLVLRPGIHSFFDNIMGKSVTKKLLSHSHIPVLGLP